MRVLIKRTIVDKIVERIEAAHASGRKPDCVLVTPREKCEILKDDRFMHFIPSYMKYAPSDPSAAETMVIHHRRFSLSVHTPTALYRHYGGGFSAVEEGQFFGLPLYAIPEQLINYVEQE